MKLADVIAPNETKTFVDTYLGRRWTVLSGASNRYESLVPWPSLNATLRQLRIPEGSRRVRLVKDGTEIPTTAYLQHNAFGESIRAGAFERQLSEGATLVLNSVDPLFDEVAELVEDTVRTLKMHAWVNLYAGWRTQRGFDLHWDDHDTIILQVHGRKAWKVYGPTCEYPIKEFDGSHVKPTAPPVWDGILEAGSLLYMPRGWWHEAVPLDEPTLHITLGLNSLKGADVLGWLGKELLKESVFRQDAPVRGSLVEQRSYLSALRAALDSALCDGELDDVWRHLESGAPQSARLDLPNAVVSKPPLQRDSILLLAGARTLETRLLSTGEWSISTKTGQWRCSAGLKNAVSLLSGIDGRRPEELYSLVEPALLLELKCLLTAMSLQGELLIRPATAVAETAVYSLVG